MRFLSLCVCLILLFSPVVNAQDEAKKIDGRLHSLYKYYFKRSLTVAIEEAKASAKVSASTNIIVKDSIPVDSLRVPKTTVLAETDISRAHSTGQFRIEPDTTFVVEGLAEIVRYTVWRYDPDGTPLIKCSIKYTGDLGDLRSLGVSIQNDLADSEFPVSAIMRMDLLPQVCALPKIEYVFANTPMVQHRDSR